MTETEVAIRRLKEDFPFPGYTDPHVEAYFNIALTVLRNLNVGSTILDFGCGPCDKTAVLQLLGYQCTGYDELLDDWHILPGNKEKILSFAAGQGIDLRLATSEALPFERESFDMVMMHDVLEHLHDSPRELLNDLLNVLKPGGYFFATVPNAGNIRKRIDVLLGRTNLPPFEGYYWSPGPWRGHIREYVKGDLAALANYLDLEIVELRGCNHMLGKVPAILKPLYIAITNILQGWRDSWLLVARKKPGWTARRQLSKEDLNRILQSKSHYRYDQL